MKMRGLTILLSSLLLGSFASASALDGMYNVQKGDCLAPAQNIQQVHVAATAQSVNYAIVFNYGGKPAFQNMHSYDMVVGTTILTPLGDTKFKMEGQYSAEGQSFDYAEFDTLTYSNPNFRKLRTTSFNLSGNVLLITETEEGFAPRVCVLTQVL
jgi:hypothetical protein